MFSRIGYVLRETGSNLKRNLTLTVASVFTVLVSLALVGGTMLVGRAVDNALERWTGGVEFIVFMNPEATQEQIDTVGRDLQENPQVERTTFFTKDQAYEEFKKFFADSPEFVESLTTEEMPTSYRVVPRDAKSEVIEAIGGQFEKKPGVLSVEYASKAVDWLETISRYVRLALMVAAGVLLLTAVLLIWNTIRTAMFARRREVEVMKLVGATNWFIRVPFMVEGMVAGLIGALGAVGALWAGKWAWERFVLDRISSAVDLRAMVVNTGDMQITVLIVLVVGVGVGVLGSAIAVSRFLDV